MGFNTKKIITDIDGKPAPQHYSPETDSYEPVKGSNGASYVQLKGDGVNPDGSINVKLDSIPSGTNNIGTVSAELKKNEVELAIDVTTAALQSARQASPGGNSLLRLNVYGDATAFSVQVQGQMYDGIWRTLSPADSLTGNDVPSTIIYSGVFDFDVSGWKSVAVNVLTVTGGKVQAKGAFLP